MAEPFLDCPKHWKRGALSPHIKNGLILKAETGTTPKTTVDEYWDGDIPWLTPKEITRTNGGIYVSETERNITEYGLKDARLKLHPPGTVMLSKRAPVGSVVVNAVPMSTNQGFINFTCGPELRPLYLAYWLKVNKPYLDLVANGSTYPEIYTGDLFEFEIAVPSLDEQDRILEVIASVQFVSMLSFPLEQSAVSAEKLVTLQRYKSRLADLSNIMIPLLLSGKFDVSHVKTSWFDK
jgi:type I restriction enzyme S subunit